MARVKRNLFAFLGWVVWKILALFGLRFAKDRLKANERGRVRS